MKLFEKIKEKLSKKTTKFLIGAMAFAVPATLSVPAHAAGETVGDVSSITGQITTALTSAKGDFVTALGAVVVVAVGFFIVKFVVKQVIGYFAKIASK